jgi:hypothetical protein
MNKKEELFSFSKKLILQGLTPLSYGLKDGILEVEGFLYR